MNINLELYKTFYYVARNGSISRAANELLISQPAISKAIKTLEEQIGTKLFIRKKDGVNLTEAGNILYEKINNAMNLIWSAENDLEILMNHESGTINIGASKTIIHEYLMPYIKIFHQKYPNINLRIFTDSKEDLIKNMKLGTIDLFFANLPLDVPNNFETIKLLELHDIFVANNDYSNLKNKKLTIQDLKEYPILLLNKKTTLRTIFDDYCTEKQISIEPKMEFSSNSLVKDFTEAGFGIGLLTREHIKKELDENKLFELDITISLKKRFLGLFYLKDQQNTVVKNFIQFIQSTKL